MIKFTEYQIDHILWPALTGLINLFIDENPDFNSESEEEILRNLIFFILGESLFFRTPGFNLPEFICFLCYKSEMLPSEFKYQKSYKEKKIK